jgi:hypothetical protein
MWYDIAFFAGSILALNACVAVCKVLLKRGTWSSAIKLVALSLALLAVQFAGDKPVDGLDGARMAIYRAVAVIL